MARVRIAVATPMIRLDRMWLPWVEMTFR
jgi:hypothetical protein